MFEQLYSQLRRTQPLKETVWKRLEVRGEYGCLGGFGRRKLTLADEILQAVRRSLSTHIGQEIDRSRGKTRAISFAPWKSPFLSFYRRRFGPRLDAARPDDPRGAVHFASALKRARRRDAPL